MKNLKIYLPVVFVILFLIFLFQNTDQVTLRLYFWQISMPQIILIPIVLLIGFACGFIAAKLTARPKGLDRAQK